MNERIYLSPPHLGDAEREFVREAFESNWIAPLGPHVDAFEREIVEKTGGGGAAVLISGTAAIHLALRLLEVRPGDTVFCSSLTFIASANPILYEGADPVFIDSEPDSWNMSPAALAKAFEWAERQAKLPKAVIVVNLYGQSADLDPILEICNRYDVPIIEDAAESLGATYKGRNSGTIGHFGIYSFNGNKIITTSGGGALLSQDADALARARFLATQARDPAPHYQHSMIGYNYRMSNVLAGIGRGQLRVLDDRVRARRAVFHRYLTALSDLPGVEFMGEMPYGLSNRWLTTLTLDSSVTGVIPMNVIDALAADNIEARPVWKPLHAQPVFKGASYFPHHDTLSASDHIFTRGLCLPSGSSLTEDEQDRVIACIREAVLPSCRSVLRV